MTTGENNGPRAGAELRAALCATYREIERLGLSIGSAGNVSTRADAGVLISQTGANGATISPPDLVAMDLDGRVQGTGKPSVEWSMHAAIYRAYSRAQAVIHAHSDACVAISCQRRPIPPFHYMVAAFGGHDVRCADYAIFGSQALANAAVAALEGRKACLLANHGMICHGTSLADALASTIKLEMLARQFCLSASFGDPVLLSAAEMDEALGRYATYGR